MLKHRRVFCATCGELQFDTPSGVTCKNGHGGEESLYRRPKRVVTTKDYVELNKMLHSQCQTWFSHMINPVCLKCKGAEEKMIRVIALWFCAKCFLEEFDCKAKKIFQPTYRRWIKVYMKTMAEKGIIPYNK